MLRPARQRAEVAFRGGWEVRVSGQPRRASPARRAGSGQGWRPQRGSRCRCHPSWRVWVWASDDEWLESRDQVAQVADIRG